MKMCKNMPKNGIRTEKNEILRHKFEGAFVEPKFKFLENAFSYFFNIIAMYFRNS